MDEYLPGLSVGMRFLSILAKGSTTWENGNRFDNPKS